MTRRVLALVLLTALMLLSTTAIYASLGDNGFGANGCTPNRGGDVKCIV